MILHRRTMLHRRWFIVCEIAADGVALKLLLAGCTLARGDLALEEVGQLPEATGFEPVAAHIDGAKIRSVGFLLRLETARHECI